MGSDREKVQMRQQIQLTPEENVKLNQILAFQSARAKFLIKLPYLLKKWDCFVTRIEEGYRLTIDDYTNDLSIRDLLQEILEVIPNNTELKKWIGELDGRFIGGTKKVEFPLLPLMNRPKVGWWWFRIPLHPGDELKKDLENW